LRDLLHEGSGPTNANEPAVSGDDVVTGEAV
jgi:hypothetical protein